MSILRVLVVDDQRSARRVLSRILRDVSDVEVLEAEDVAGARACLEESSIDLALVDLRLSENPSDRSGHALIRYLRAHTTTDAIVVTAFAEMVEVREALRAGARDYLLKDELCADLVLPLVERVREERALRAEVVNLRARHASTPADLSMIGDSPAINTLREMIRRVAVSGRPVLVTGPSGAGKELAVAAIHRLGPRPEAPLLDLNCATLTETLVESQLFGHERGAFTGADRERPGFFESAGQGTLFLDEVGELPLALQAKLLRVLETGRYRRVGATESRSFEGRLVLATHRDLATEVREGRFREDLYFRVAVLQVRVPALSERAEDVPALLSHFARRETRPLRFDASALSVLMARPWPGNIRELRNVVARLAVFSDDDPVTANTLEHVALEPPPLEGASLDAFARAALALPSDGDRLEGARTALIRMALVLSGGNKSGAARLLGVHRKVIERAL